MSARFEVADLRVQFDGRTVVHIEALDLEPGSLAVVEGAAGSGKTVLAAAACGDTPSTGQVRVGGRLLTGPPSRRVAQGLAAAVRDGQQIRGCTVREALLLAARRGSRAGQALARIPQLGTRSGLAAELLSGGEQQLLQVACAWCTSAPVMLLDSPTVGLAADAAELVSSLVYDAVASGTTVVWLEQDPRAAPAAPMAALVSGSLVPAAASSASPEPATE